MSFEFSSGRTRTALDAFLDRRPTVIDDIQKSTPTETHNHSPINLSLDNDTGDLSGWDRLSPRLFALCNSPNSSDKLAGVKGIEEIVDSLPEENIIAVKLANCLLRALNSSELDVISLSARVYGQLTAINYSKFMQDAVNMHLKSALESLQGMRVEHTRYAAAALLKEISRSAPSSISSETMHELLDNIWIPLTDHNAIIREEAAMALSGCLAAVARRQERDELYKLVFEQAQNSIEAKSVEQLHGSYLAYMALLRDAGEAAQYLKPLYNTICDQILACKNHKSPLIREQVLHLIPVLASFDSKQFASRYLTQCMDFLLHNLSSEKDLSHSYQAIAQIAVSMNDLFLPFVDRCIYFIKLGLAVPRKRNISADALVNCIGGLAKAFGIAIEDTIDDILDSIFSIGLTPSLRATATEIGNNIPSLQPKIKEKMMHLLEEVFDANTVGEENRKSDIDNEQVILAIETLSDCDCMGISIVQFALDKVLPLSKHDDLRVKSLSIRVTAAIFAQDPISSLTSKQSVLLMWKLLDVLLSVALTDNSPDVRRVAIQSLHPEFDKNLSLVQYTNQILLAMNDGSTEVRRAATYVIGRLFSLNKAHIDPAVRKLVIQHLMRMKYPNNINELRESTELLGMFYKIFGVNVLPYVELSLEALYFVAKHSSPAVSISAITAMGNITQVGRNIVKPHRGEFMTILVSALNDQTSTLKRYAALTTLRKYASVTGYVIKPYQNYPGLLRSFLSIAKEEQRLELRAEALKTLCTLGAIDPFRSKLTYANETKESINTATAVTEDVCPPDDGYYPAVTFSALLDILKSNSKRKFRPGAVEAILTIFRSLRHRCLDFLPLVITTLAEVIRGTKGTALEHYFQNICQLVAIVREHIRSNASVLIQLAVDFWNNSHKLRKIILDLVENLAYSVPGSFNRELYLFIPLFFQALEDNDPLSSIDLQVKILEILSILSSDPEYLHLVIPNILSLIRSNDYPLVARKEALSTLEELGNNIRMNEYVVTNVHTLVQVLSSGPSELYDDVVRVLSSQAAQLGEDFQMFVPMVSMHLKHNNSSVLLGDIDKLLQGKRLEEDSRPSKREPSLIVENIPAADAGMNKLPINENRLRAAWKFSGVQSNTKWKEWIKQLSIQLLQSSSVHPLRACANLGESCEPLARELFNPAFLSCWTELSDELQGDILSATEQILQNTTVPSEVEFTLLGMVEYMDRIGLPLPIPIERLSKYAELANSYEQALYWKEQENGENLSHEKIEGLLRINRKLRQPDYSDGILKVAEQTYGKETQGLWYETAERWEDCLKACELEVAAEPNNMDVAMRRIKCLRAVGEWELTSNLVRDFWEGGDGESRKLVAPYGAETAFYLHKWEDLEKYLSFFPTEAENYDWFSTILDVHQKQYGNAREKIENMWLNKVSLAVVGETYASALPLVNNLSLLTELKDVIEVMEQPDDPELRKQTKSKWKARLWGCHRDPELWTQIIAIRSLALEPSEQASTWIKFSDLCRRSDQSIRVGWAFRTMSTFSKNYEEDKNWKPSLAEYSRLKYKWKTGEKTETLRALEEHINQFAKQLKSSLNEPTHSQESVTRGKEYLAKYHLRRGEWLRQLASENSGPSKFHEIFKSYSVAMELRPNWHKSIHAWAMVNIDVASRYSQKNKSENIEQICKHIVCAIQGLVDSMTLPEGDTLPDALRLLSLWFTYGSRKTVRDAVREGIIKLNLNVWLNVIPQIVARIHTENNQIRRAVQRLLADLGKAHPHALVYALSVASKYPDDRRRKMAIALLDKIREHSARVTDQALLVAEELHRVSILWAELWLEGLRTALNRYHNPDKWDSMLDELLKMHQAVEKPPESIDEYSFQKSYGESLKGAKHLCMRYKETKKTNFLSQAYEYYMDIYSSLQRNVNSMKSLDLQYVSPRLHAARDLEVAVPGIYQGRNGEEVIRIAAFLPNLSVFASMQRPRKVIIKGSDGKNYTFLLKGNEDMRLDERAMQLFGLVNTQLIKHPETLRRELKIIRYPIIPLSPNSGILGILENMDSKLALIESHREKIGVSADAERQRQLKFAPQFEKLCLLQQIEAFEHVFEKSKSDDLARIQWLKSTSCEEWIIRRKAFVRSLAVMSMVGHILGLGDRHPLNILISRSTGEVVHVDLSYCFESARQRPLWPEHVPFRLTRMFVKAMGLTGVEGSFRATCEKTMHVLRENREGIVAVLEAFVHDPLVNWRLVKQNDEKAGGEERHFITSHDAEASFSAETEEVLQIGQAGKDLGVHNEETGPEENERAVEVIEKVQLQLKGCESKTSSPMSVSEQVDKLINEAMNVENLVRHFPGW